MHHDNLWAPWRMDYIKSLEPAPAAGPAGEVGCFLCAATKLDAHDPEARKHLLLVNDDRGLIVLNRYPYTTGHLLIAPRGHLPDLADLDAAQRTGLMDLTVLGEKIIRQAFNPQGLNIGINLGRCAGAGLPGHMHLHIVPRWNGDTNFMNIVGQVRVIPQALEASYDLLKKSLG